MLIVNKHIYIYIYIDTTYDKIHYRLKDATGLLLDGTYHVNCIKKGSACTPQGRVNTLMTINQQLSHLIINL